MMITSLMTFFMVAGAFYYYVAVVKPELKTHQKFKRLSRKKRDWHKQIFSGDDEFINFKEGSNIRPEDLFLNDPVFRVDLAVDPGDISNSFSSGEGELTFQFSLKSRVRIWDKPIAKINTSGPFEQERYTMLCKLTFKSFSESNVRIRYSTKEQVKTNCKDSNPKWIFQLSSPDITVGLPLDSTKRVFDQIIQCRHLQTPLELRLQLKSTDHQMICGKYENWFELPVTGIDIGSKFK